MEPYDINAGRFYLRAMHNQIDFDDSDTLRGLDPQPPVITKDDAEEGWMSDTIYSWAVCEQTSSDLLALIIYQPPTDTMSAYPAGDPATVWDHNRELEPVTLGQAAEAGAKAVRAAVNR